MGGIGRIIGGALAGLGDGLEQQTKLNYQTTRDDLINQREIALAKLRGEIERDNTQTQYDLMDRNDGRKQARDFSYDTGKAVQKHEFDKQDIVLKGNIDLANDTTIEGLKHEHKMSEDQYQSALDLERSLAESGEKVAYKVVSPKGEVGFYNERGQLLSQTGLGVETPPHKADDDDGDPPNYANPTSAKPTGQKPVKQSILSQLARMPPPPGGRVGATMTGPQGMKARWTGKQWELIGETVPRG